MPPGLIPIDPIKYLVDRRFPNWNVPVSMTISSGQFERAVAYRKMREEALAYERELQQKTPEELSELLKAAREAQALESRRKQEAEENARFFNWPYANADFSHWGKIAYWTLDEAVALSFGRAPEIVNWKSVESLASVSLFASQYKRRRELTVRAKTFSELYDPVRPGFFIAWAKRLELEFPTELEALIVARGDKIGDWRALFENEKAAHAKTMEWAKSQINEVMQTAKQHQAEAFEIGRKGIADRDTEIARLRDALEAAEVRKGAEDHQVPKGRSQDPGPRERESMLRIIIGMAIRGYTYDPTALKNKAVRDIADDLQHLGIGLDEDTIRKYLQEAKDILPRQTD